MMTMECLDPWPAAIERTPEARWRCSYCRATGTLAELAKKTCAGGAEHPQPQEPAMARVVMKQIPGSVYIGRAGRGEDGYFGNPYRAGETCSRCRCEHWSGGSTLACFENYLNDRAAMDPEFKQRVENLRGKFLWCPGGCKKKRLPCHGDILAAYANGEKQWRTTA